MDKNIFIERCSEFIIKINEKYPVNLAYLFGSRAKNTENVMSDIDIALYFTNNYDVMNDALVRGDIIELGFEFFKIDVDVVSLNYAPLLLKYEVIKDGIIIFEKSPLGRIEFEVKVMREYLDFKYYSDIYDEKILKSFKKINTLEDNLW